MEEEYNPEVIRFRDTIRLEVENEITEQRITSIEQISVFFENPNKVTTKVRWLILINF